MSDKRKPAYWAVLPSRVRYDPELRPNAKLLYAEISALQDSSGYCFASNEHLASLFELSAKTISELISTLAKKGYLRVDIMRDPNTNEVVERRIWAEAPPLDRHTPPPKNRDTPLPKKPVTPPPKNREENNINNINIYTPIPPKGGVSGSATKKNPDWKPERFEGFWKYYPRGESKQAAIRAWDKLRPSDDLCATMGQALARQLETEEWKRGIGIPYASTWLNNRRWEDDRLRQPSASTTVAGGWAADPEVI